MTDRSKLRLRDVVSTSVVGLRSRRGRTVLTALGIAIGIASMVAVVGISSSSKAALLAQLDSLGTNLLKVEAANSGLSIEPLPIDAEPMIRRIENVQSASAVIDTGAEVRRNAEDATLVGIGTLAATPEFFPTLGATTPQADLSTTGSVLYPSRSSATLRPSDLGSPISLVAPQSTSVGSTSLSSEFSMNSH